MKPNFGLIISGVIAIFLLTMACNFPGLFQTSQIEPDIIYTQAAQTFVAQLTQIVETVEITPSIENQATIITTVTPPIARTNSATFSISPSPTQTPIPSVTLSSGAKLTAQFSPTPVPCLAAQFVKDVSVPDGTLFFPGESFTKIWRLRNSGSCPWSPGFSMVFDKGDSMSGLGQPLGEVVDPGQTIDIDLDLIAPATSGVFRGNWLLADEKGVRFGIGSNANKPFWVQIEVEALEEGIIYNFAVSYCSAIWQSDDGDLPCPGEENDRSGFVLRLSEPDLETRQENELTLWTQPARQQDGWIAGTYPPLGIKTGDHFLADVGCLADHDGCDVVFQLKAKLKDGTERSLGEWREIYDSKITRIDLDLSSLNGENISFVLVVYSNGSPFDDAPFWLMPQIRQP